MGQAGGGWGALPAGGGCTRSTRNRPRRQHELRPLIPSSAGHSLGDSTSHHCPDQAGPAGQGHGPELRRRAGWDVADGCVGTSNPRVGGSSPSGRTTPERASLLRAPQPHWHGADQREAQALRPRLLNQVNEGRRPAPHPLARGRRPRPGAPGSPTRAPPGRARPASRRTPRSAKRLTARLDYLPGRSSAAADHHHGTRPAESGPRYARFLSSAAIWVSRAWRPIEGSPSQRHAFTTAPNKRRNICIPPKRPERPSGQYAPRRPLAYGAYARRTLDADTTSGPRPCPRVPATRHRQG